MKFCKKCGEHKHLDNFYKSKSTKDGYGYYCKICDNANKEKRRAKYRKLHPIKYIDYTGKIFGRLIVLEQDKKRIHHRPGKFWLCKCECGKTVSIYYNALTSGTTKSCDCLHSEMAKEQVKVAQESWKLSDIEFYNSLRNKIYDLYIYHAKRRNLSFELTKDEFFKLNQENCNYCGTSPNNIMKRKHNNIEYKYNGIDRKNNKLGYTLENSVACCKFCNFAKGNRDLKEFEDWLDSVGKFRIKNKD